MQFAVRGNHDGRLVRDLARCGHRQVAVVTDQLGGVGRVSEHQVGPAGGEGGMQIGEIGIGGGVERFARDPLDLGVEYEPVGHILDIHIGADGQLTSHSLSPLRPRRAA